MSQRLKDNLNSQYFEAANSLTSKKARRRIVAYVESYDDIYFWRTVLSEFENDKRYFEVMLPSKGNLTRGKKSVLMNFLEGEPLGRDMIACVDADYDYLIQRRSHQSQKVLDSPYVFHTYVYAIENYQCYAPSLHNVCVSVTLNDHRIFDFREYFRAFSEALFPLFVWSIMLYRNGNYPRFSITDLNRIYLEKDLLNVETLGQGFTWLDTGTHESLLEASNFVMTVETHQHRKIGCLEEIGYINGWISREDVERAAEEMKKNEYGQYLRDVLDGKYLDLR